MKQTIDVAYVAELARITLTDAERVKLQAQMEGIVQYVEKIRELDVSDVEPTLYGQDFVNAFREDTVTPSLNRDDVLANAPDRSENEFKLPKIVEDA